MVVEHFPLDKAMDAYQLMREGNLSICFLLRPLTRHIL